jgi:alpha-N-acetylglucosaminidase
LASPARGQLVGIGLVNEGLGNNPVMNDFVGEMTWRTEVPEIPEWIRGHIAGRYGGCPAAAEEAWQLLSATVYRTAGNTGSAICMRPLLEGSVSCASVAAPPYDNAQLAMAWQKLLSCSEQLGNVDAYRFDLVHVGRQVLANLAFKFRQEFAAAYRQKDRRAMVDASQRFLQLIRDVDELLGTRRELLLGRWLADAKRWAANDEERRLYEWNARTIITLWGPRDSGLYEYANRQWAGLLAGFYLPRWEQFFQQVDAALAADKPFDAAAFDNTIRDWEVQWTHEAQFYPDTPQGDSVAISRRLWEKYKKFF